MTVVLPRQRWSAGEQVDQASGGFGLVRSVVSGCRVVNAAIATSWIVRAPSRHQWRRLVAPQPLKFRSAPAAASERRLCAVASRTTGRRGPAAGFRGARFDLFGPAPGAHCHWRRGFPGGGPLAFSAEPRGCVVAPLVWLRTGRPAPASALAAVALAIARIGFGTAAQLSSTRPGALGKQHGGRYSTRPTRGIPASVPAISVGFRPPETWLLVTTTAGGSLQSPRLYQLRRWHRVPGFVPEHFSRLLGPKTAGQHQRRGGGNRRLNRRGLPVPE